MAVSDPTTIDMVIKSEESGGRLTLVIQVPLTWADGGQEQLDQLIAKVNGYLGWIQTGGCVQMYPEAAQGVDILLACMDEPTGDTAELLVSLHNQFAQRYGIGVYYKPVFAD